MYFKPELSEALIAGQKLAGIILSGNLVIRRTEALDCAFFVAGTANAYLAGDQTPINPTLPENPDPNVVTTTDYSSFSAEELAQLVTSDEPTTNSIPITVILAMAKKIICSL